MRQKRTSVHRRFSLSCGFRRAGRGGQGSDASEFGFRDSRPVLGRRTVERGRLVATAISRRGEVLDGGRSRSRGASASRFAREASRRRARGSGAGRFARAWAGRPTAPPRESEKIRRRARAGWVCCYARDASRRYGRRRVGRGRTPVSSTLVSLLPQMPPLPMVVRWGWSQRPLREEQCRTTSSTN